MEFQIKNLQKSTNDLMRTLGYKPAFFQKAGEVSIVRLLGRGEYPRFHLYIKELRSTVDQSMVLNFSLHLDQKKPSYEGQTGHSGDYDGPVVEGEAKRIRGLLGLS